MTITLDASPTKLLPARSPWGTLASFGLHGALAALLVIGPNLQRLRPMMPRSIAVEMISAVQFAALTQPDEVPPSDAPTAPSAATTPGAEVTGPAQKAAPGGTIRATDFYAGSLLAEPASAKLRAAMKTLDGSERLVQLCSIEAIEQIRRARPEFDPDTVVAYAMADMTMRDGALVADGGAFRSRREWYGVHFNCSAAADFSRVETFAFSVGEFIPHEEWDAHYLTAAEDEDD